MPKRVQERGPTHEPRLAMPYDPAEYARALREGVTPRMMLPIGQ